MTIETNADSQQQATTEETTNLSSQQDTTQTSTDQSPEAIAAAAALAAQTPEQIAAATAEADAAAAAAAAKTEETAGADDVFKFADDEEGKKLKEFVGKKTPTELAKELMNAQALLGKKVIGIPGKDSTPEEQRAFHKARGVPETEADYDLKPALEELTKTAPEGWKPSPEIEGAFRKAARLSNMSQSEAQNFAQHFLGHQFEAQKEFVANEVKATRDASAMLAKAWGADRTVGEANFARGMKAVGLPPESVDVFLAVGGGNAAARFGLVQAVAEIGRRQMEGGPVPGQSDGQGAVTMTKEQAIQEQSRIKADPELSKAFMDPSHKDHKRISAEMARLGKIERGIS